MIKIEHYEKIDFDYWTIYVVNGLSQVREWAVYFFSIGEEQSDRKLEIGSIYSEW